MRRVLIALITTLPLAVGVAAAQAAPPSFPGFPGLPGGTGTGTGTQQATVVGTVVSVDAGAGTFVAKAYALTPPSIGTGSSTGTGWGSGTGTSGSGTSGSGTSGSGTPGSGLGGLGGIGFTRTVKSSDMPTATEVTITTNSSTTIKISGVTGTPTVGDLVPGARFFATFPGSSSDTIQTLVASPATAIYSQVPKQIYGFVGTVTGTNPTAGTLTTSPGRSRAA
jgi:hypothetical protein